MRNRTWSDVVMAAMIALCFATAAKQQAQPPIAATLNASPTTEIAPNLSEAAQSLAVAVLLSNGATDRQPQDVSDPRTPSSAADRAMANAAQAAGNVARDIEMPFFSFGGDASAE